MHDVIDRSTRHESNTGLPDDATDGMPLMEAVHAVTPEVGPRFARYMRQRIRHILDVWRERVEADHRIVSSAKLGRLEFHDHMPDVLEDFCDRIEHEKDEGDRPPIARSARIHGSERWQQDYSLAEVLLEIDRFRNVLIDESLRQFSTENPDIDSDALRPLETVIYDYCRELIVGSVVRYSEERDQAMLRQQDELRASHEAIDRVNAELRRETEKVRLLSLNDPLTEIANRRHLQEELERALKQASRYGEPLALALLDIDHFKSINDTFGHLVGDQALRFVAQQIVAECRESDLPARYGGEEFCVMMPQTALRAAATMMERLRSHLEACPLDSVDRSITVSIGIAERRRDDSTAAMLARADVAMYRAKASGRNRIELLA